MVQEDTTWLEAWSRQVTMAGAEGGESCELPIVSEQPS